MSVLAEDSPSAEEIHRSGEQLTEARPGSLRCVTCGFAFPTGSTGELPECPNCHGSRFRRASLFSSGPNVDSNAVEVAKTAPEWLQEARAEIDRAGTYLAFDEGGEEYAVIRLEPGWTRIGRSVAADVQLDDPTVSRRHALVVLTETGDLRVLDDRSLNGMFVNGEPVEGAALDDGDELEIGRYRVYVVRA
jgi:predicted  nucleic acid-binding Zn-ribbon protein